MKGRKRAWKDKDVAGIENGWQPTGCVVHRVEEKRYYAVCRCVCGKVAEVRVLGDGTLKTSRCASCAMKQGRFNLKHGQCVDRVLSPTYQSWHAMINRCKHPCVMGYENYGGRGVKVCERWKSLQNFIADMGERPSLKHSLDRIDNDGDYEPGNCRWATRKEQGRNQRTNTFLTIDGETKTMVEWSEDHRAVVCYETIISRLQRGWPAKEAVMLPQQKPGRKPEGVRLYQPKGV